jgi:DMSO/TMAO reductase YedYZ molybdopterin-dependent catalytic subunit
MDRVPQVALRGDRATIHTKESSFEKAYTVVTLGPIFDFDTSGEFYNLVKTSPYAPAAIEITPRILRYRTRRDVLLFGAGAAAALAGGGFLLPQDTLSRLGVDINAKHRAKEWLLNKALRIDDDMAEALCSENRRVPTYTKSQITPLKNNYNGATPDPGYISGRKLTLAGLASGLSISLDIRNLLTRFQVHDQITRLVCVEGWSAIAWWSGLRFDDLLRAHPPMSLAKWARVESSVNLDDSGNPDLTLCPSI